MSPIDELVCETVRFSSAGYELEAELVYPESSVPKGSVLIAGPHPMLGGDMGNNVVRGVGDELSDRGFVVLRFNYRGVGESQGPAIDVAENLAEFWQTSHVANEMDFQLDLTAAWEFLRDAVRQDGPSYALGYSFGCSLLAGLCTDRHPDALVLIAPTIGKHDYTKFASVLQPVLVVAPLDDFAADFSLVSQWYETLPQTKEMAATQRDGHFFRGHEPWLAKTIACFLEKGWRR